jgi:hypothetical protein
MRHEISLDSLCMHEQLLVLADNNIPVVTRGTVSILNNLVVRLFSFGFALPVFILNSRFIYSEDRSSFKI